MMRPASVLLVAGCLCSALVAEARKADPLLGTWRAEAIERKGTKRKVEGIKLLAIFERKGRFISVLSDDRHGERRRTGTWKRVGRRTILTVIGKRKDRAVYTIDGKQLVLKNPASGQRLFLHRVK